MKRLYLFFFFLFFLVQTIFAQGFFYKRFEGTINKTLPIVVHLTKNNKNEVSGNYYYVKNGAPIYISGSFDPQKSALKMEEYDSQHNNTGIFEGTLKKDLIEGVWKTADGKKSFALSLKENYNEAAKFDSYYVEKDFLLFEDQPNFAKASATEHFLYPTQTHDPKQLGALQKLFRKQLNEYGTKPIPEILQAQINQYGEDYIKLNSENRSKEEMLADEMSFMYSWTSDNYCGILYNDKHILSVEMAGSQYTGGAHGNYGSTFLVVDIRLSKKLSLTDIFNPNYKTALDAILVKIAKKDYQDAVDGTPEATENFYVNGAGVNFVYNPYEIAPYSSGQITLSVPFSQLKNLLKPNSSISHLVK